MPVDRLAAIGRDKQTERVREAVERARNGVSSEAAAHPCRSTAQSSADETVLVKQLGP